MSDSETKTVTIPKTNEFGDVSLLVESKERQETQTIYYTTIGGVRSPSITLDVNSFDPHKELSRVIFGGKYKLELIRGRLTTDKPLLKVIEL